jgi:hypothetical protein
MMNGTSSQTVQTHNQYSLTQNGLTKDTVSVSVDYDKEYSRTIIKISQMVQSEK